MGCGCKHGNGSGGSTWAISRSERVRSPRPSLQCSSWANWKKSGGATGGSQDRLPLRGRVCGDGHQPRRWPTSRATYSRYGPKPWAMQSSSRGKAKRVRLIHDIREGPAAAVEVWGPLGDAAPSVDWPWARTR